MAIDTSWSSVVLHLPMDGTNGSTTIVDAKGKTPTITGNTQISTAQSLTGGSSCYFDGTGDRLTYAASSDWDLSGGNFAIEFSVYPTVNVTGATCRLFLIGTNGTTSAFYVGISSTMKIQCYVPYGSPTGLASADNVVVANTWNRFELSVSAGTGRIFKDGALVAGPTVITLPSSSSSNPLYIGYDTVATVNFNYQGYLDRVRITKGAARHTAAFTSDDDPFPRPTISGVVYDDVGAKAEKAVYVRDRCTGLVVGGALSDATTGEYTFYPNDFGEYEVVRYDEVSDPTTSETVFNLVARSRPLGACTLRPVIDTQGHELTVKYDARADSTQTPYAGTASVYFDGSSDCLQSTNIDFALGLNDFSIEFWYRPINGGHGGSWARVLQIGQNSTNGTLYLACSSSDNPSYLRCEFYSGSWQLVVQTTGTVSNNAWHFVQLRRVNGDFFMYLDGVLQGSKTGVSYNITATQLSIGANTVYGESFYGNVGPLRISRGPVRASTVVPAATALKPLVDGGSGENALIYDRVIPG